MHFGEYDADAELRARGEIGGRQTVGRQTRADNEPPGKKELTSVMCVEESMAAFAYACTYSWMCARKGRKNEGRAGRRAGGGKQDMYATCKRVSRTVQSHE